MHMVTKRNFSLLIFLFSVVTSFGIDFTRVNLSWQYDPLAEISLQHRTIQNGSLITVFLSFKADSLNKWNYEIWKQEKYNTTFHKVFESVVVDTLSRKQKEILTKLTFEKPSEGLMVIKLSKANANYYYDIPLRNGSLPFPSYYPSDGESNLPILSNYLTRSNINWVGQESFYAAAYIEDFDIADPPMAKMRPLAPSVNPDSAFVFKSRTSFKDGYFYVIQEDSNSAGGVTILKSPPYYPELKRLDELVFAMHYILNETEKNGIRASKNIRQSFDSFWINTYKTKFRARNAIRNYFNWVEQANRLYTDFKPGWKTDRGMLFIVFGVPDEVYRSENYEEWYYDQGPAFEFTILATFFSPRTFALRRRIGLEKSWYEYISAIRRGSNE